MAQKKEKKKITQNNEIYATMVNFAQKNSTLTMLTYFNPKVHTLTILMQPEPFSISWLCKSLLQFLMSIKDEP